MDAISNHKGAAIFAASSVRNNNEDEDEEGSPAPSPSVDVGEVKAEMSNMVGVLLEQILSDLYLTSQQVYIYMYTCIHISYRITIMVISNAPRRCRYCQRWDRVRLAPRIAVECCRR